MDKWKVIEMNKYLLKNRYDQGLQTSGEISLSSAPKSGRSPNPSFNVQTLDEFLGNNLSAKLSRL